MQRDRCDQGLIWITGLSGSGKSTLALALQRKFRDEDVHAIVLDGDDLRECLNANGRYSYVERLELARTYSRFANLLVRQRHLIIVATMSLFHEVHRMNRLSPHAYFEVFLDLPISTLRQRDFKNLYGSDDTQSKENVGGVNLELEVPLHPHLHITDAEITPDSLAAVTFDQFQNL